MCNADETTTGPLRAVNRYAGTCALCGVRVAPEAGYLDGPDDFGRWHTRCARCGVRVAPEAGHLDGPDDFGRWHTAFPPVPPVVPPGRYALPGDDGELRCYVVSHGTGRWAGYVFLAATAGDDHGPVRDRGRRDRILSEIAADPSGARRRYRMSWLA